MIKLLIGKLCEKSVDFIQIILITSPNGLINKGEVEMKFALCDSRGDSPAKTVEIIENYAKDNNIKIEYEIFDRFENLKDRLDEFDLFIIDYTLPDMNGMDFSRYLREKCSNKKVIIFVTSSSEIVYDSFELRPYRFILKPIDEYKLRKAIDDFINDYESVKKILFTFGSTIYTVRMNNIRFIESQNKYTEINMCDGEAFRSRESLASFEKSLNSKNFYRTHRSFIVNINSIKRIENRICILDNGVEVPISKNRYTKFMFFMRIRNQR